MSTEHEVESFFNTTASQYDDMISQNGWAANGMLRKILRRSDTIRTALDLGAGTGLSTEVILDETEAEKVVAIDISQAMLEKLQQRCGNETRLSIARMAIAQFLTETHIRFDLVTAIGLLHFLPEPQSVFSDVAEAMNGQGRFIFTYDPYLPGHPIHGERQTEYDVTSYRSAPQDIRHGLSKNGFRIEDDRIFVPQPTGNTDYLCGFVVARRDGSKAPSDQAGSHKGEMSHPTFLLA